MALLDYVLEIPGYGWKDRNGNLVKPTTQQILKEFFKRLNIFKTKKSWLPFFSWIKVALLAPF
jgi:stearoyl-CoA desaturase (delta-9 desaturase)